MLDSFRLRLTLFFVGLSLVLGLGPALYVHQVASAKLTQASGETLQGLGRSAALLLARTLYEREREVRLLSKTPSLTRGAWEAPALRERLDEIKASYPHYVWVGVVDVRGEVRAAGDGLWIGQNVAERPWFRAGLTGTFVGDMHEALGPQPGSAGGVGAAAPLRFVDFAAPIRDPSGSVRGVVATHVHGSWGDAIFATVLGQEPLAHGVEALILSRSGAWLYPFEAVGVLPVPADLPVEGAFQVVQWPDGGDYLTARLPVRADTANELGWQIILRQPVAKALAPVAEMRRDMLLLAAVAVVLAAFLAYRLAGSFSRPVEQLAVAAQVIAQGNDTHAFEVASRLREIRELAAALRDMTDTLAAQRWDLQAINFNLERQIEARTLELQEANQALARLARQDPLTGLHNRRAADERLEAEFQRWTRSGAEYAVLLMDIDCFKRVNDTHGHEVGDRVLQHVASELRQQMRSTDFLARFGGEEFLAILPDTDRDGARVMAEKLRHHVAERPIAPVGQVTLSIGLAPVKAEDGDCEAAVRRADAALYAAKDAGRNRVVG